MQAGYNYEKAFENTAALVREIMRETGIPLERVYRHYDICSKYCPSQIMNRGDWDRMKRMIGSGAGSTGTGTAGSGTGKRMRPGSIRCRQRPSTSVRHRMRTAGLPERSGIRKLHGDGNPEHKLGTASLRGRLGQLPYSVLPLCRSRKRKIGRDSKAIRKDSRRGRNLGRKSDAPSAGTFRHTAGWKNQQSAGRQPEIL